MYILAMLTGGIGVCGTRRDPEDRIRKELIPAHDVLQDGVGNGAADLRTITTVLYDDDEGIRIVFVV